MRDEEEVFLKLGLPDTASKDEILTRYRELQSEEQSQKYSIDKYNIPIIISLIVGTFYFYGWWYTFSYFTYFDLYINHDLLPFSPSYYLEKAIVPVGLSIIFFFISFVGSTNLIVTRLDAARHNLIIPIYIISIVIFIAIKTNISIFNHIFLIIFVIILVLYVIFMWKNYSVRNIFLMASHRDQAILLFALIFALVFIGGVTAQFQAIHTLESDKIIAFSWNGPIPEETKDKELVPIICRNGNYYVAERQNPVLKKPEVYVIPENQIKLATIKRINKD